MKRVVSLLTTMALITSLSWQTQASGASPIRIYMNGIKLAVDQAPIEQQGRVLLPLRAIFEALDATVVWNAKTGVITAKKEGTTVTLKVGSKSATINNQKVTLDVPAQEIKGRTLVPVRFVSTALGANVDWKASARSVYVKSDHTTDPGQSGLSPVAYVTPRIISQYGDGRDLNVSFSKSANESQVNQYRVLIVKSSKSGGFGETAARQVSSANYTAVGLQGSDRSVNLSSQARDTDGELLRSGLSYNVYVLTVGSNGHSVLSGASSAVTLGSGSAATSVKGTDIADYGDGRDLSVSFTKAQSESNIANYRIFAVKTKDAGSFNLSSASSVAASNYTTVSKTGASTLSAVLGSSARDTSGEYLRNGVSYTLYVMSVSSNLSTASHQLSAGSPAITLNSGTVTAPYITAVSDISDYSDGRDVRISFNKVSDESRISGYRVFAVREQNASSFTLSSAKALSSSYYTTINKSGYNISQQLNSNSRDVNGSLLTNGVAYRFFVMAVGTGSYSGTDTLSSMSSSLTLWNNTNVNAVTGLSVSDVSDYNDGRDLRVSFARAGSESNISHYRIFVVRSNVAGSFNLSAANNLSSSYYTYVSKTGFNINQVLPSEARDTDGYPIRNGISYRVFVLSVGTSGYAGSNALSSYSSAIILNDNLNVSPVTGVSAADVNNNNNGTDLRINFNRISDESTISHYRVFVVNNASAGSFNLSSALTSSYYTQVNKTGSNLSQILAAGTRDTNGNLIQNGTAYRVFVLSVGGGYYAGSNALSSASPVITLANTSSVGAVTDVTAVDTKDYGDARDLKVTFSKAPDETALTEYRIFVVKSEYAGNFTKTEANSNTNYTSVGKTGAAITKSLASGAKDTDGNTIRSGISYRVFVLSVGNGTSALSASSQPVTLTVNTKVEPAANVTAAVYKDGAGKATGVGVTFNLSATPSNVKEYRVFVVPSGSGTFDLAAANDNPNFTKNVSGQLTIPITSKDTSTNPISAGKYKVYVLTVSSLPEVPNVLSAPSAEITVGEPPSVEPPAAEPVSVKPVTGVTASLDPSKPKQIAVTYTEPTDTHIASYTVALVPEGETNVTAANVAAKSAASQNVSKEAAAVLDAAAAPAGTYKVYVLSKANGTTATVDALSAPSTSISIGQ
ncbi:copper amine oxidase N-terminal domain-containing protein [Paenibacillus sp. YPG26]|uniref:copper amine oxidase N-terminal domain-containing protein n=1 Tax=Paenibacillus sp. YPG26 TaxID=2878915 RepID=UPI00203B922F|nr:copper amine oxidase N-terminal domain-containing protein [Paenibacillus sp. YPG26]USB33560.1 copper amine oxidase N-terminal domain-containing protein [Paenibacillus sp. YPG26]